MYVTDSWHIALMVANRRAQDTTIRQHVRQHNHQWIVDEVGH